MPNRIRPIDDREEAVLPMAAAPEPVVDEPRIDLLDEIFRDDDDDAVFEREFDEIGEIPRRAEMVVENPAGEAPLVFGGGLMDGLRRDFVGQPPINPIDQERRRREAEQRAEDFLRLHGARGGRRRPGGGRVRRDGDVELPGDIIEEPLAPMPRPIPQPMRKTVKKKVYPEEGVMFRGHTYARTLSFPESDYLSMYGYTECIRRYPDLEYREKEKPIDDKEECIILMSELADHYATEECKRTLQGFDLKDHNKEYQVAYKKHLKAITGFKRNKNG